MMKLRPYQKIAYDRGKQQNLLLADDRGLGKTLIAVETAAAIMTQRLGPALIIVPKHLREQWQETISEQYPNAIVAVVEARTVLEKPFASNRAIWIITHYEALVKHVKRLAQTQWSVVIADEAHRIKNRQAQRTKALKQLKTFRKLALTGTPYDRNPADVWSLLNWLDPRSFTSYWRFFQEHVRFSGALDGPKTIHGVQNAERFTRVLAPYTIRRSKREVAPDLPQKIEQHIKIEMTKAQASLYERIQEIAEMDLELDTGNPIIVKNHLARILRLQQAAVDPRLLGTDENGAKIDFLLEYVQDNPNDTLLVFTRFRDTAIRVAKLLNVPYYVGGAHTLGSKHISAYPRIVATIDAAKEGLNLGHIWTTIFLDCQWSSIAMAQAIDRTERDLDATEPRVIMYLEATHDGEETVDGLVRRALAGKWSTIELVNTWLRRVGDMAS